MDKLPQEILELICCPQCNKELKSLSCQNCNTEYPSLEGTPWLLENPKTSLSYWQKSLHKTLGSLKGQAQSIRAQAEASSNLSLTTKRLRKVAQAKYEQANLIEKLLGSLMELLQVTPLTEDLFPNQDLTSYIDNIHRDWSWGKEENNISIDCLKRLVENEDVSNSTVLFLGAGAGRLAYDFHRTFGPKNTLVTDINPLLLTVASNIIPGQKIKLYDFPIAPKSLEECLLLNKLQAEEPIKNGIHFLFADAIKTPFKESSIDIVITPWLIDILPGAPDKLMVSINRILKSNGKWLNFGPLGFSHQETRFHYSLEEIKEGLVELGFSLEKDFSQQIPYMQNPHSQHGRVEQVFCFKTSKTKSVSQKTVEEILPEWLINTKSPIPKEQHFENLKATHNVAGAVFNEINGGNSLEQIAKNLAPQFGLSEQETLDSLKRFLKRNLP